MTASNDREALIALGRSLVAKQMQNPGVLGGALDGSLATGRVWPTSDLDFTIFPARSRRPAEGEKVPAYRFFYAQGPLAKHHQYVELRVVDGVFVNMHIKTKEALDCLIGDYPASFIESADSIPGDLEPTHFLDGLAVMKVIEDPTGLLAATKDFVVRHRFSSDVLPHRLKRMLRAAEDKLAACRAGASAFDALARHDIGRTVAQMWLEAHARIYSKKEQDSLLAEVAQEAALPEIHALYRAVLGLDLPGDTLKSMLAPIDAYAKRLDALFGIVEEMALQRADALGADWIERCQAYRLWARLTLESIPVAFDKGSYAHIAFALHGVGPSALNRFLLLLQGVAPSHAKLMEDVCRGEIEESRAIWEFFGLLESPGDAASAGSRMEAASTLVELTKQRLISGR
jgi:hypothetical protein